MFEEAVDPLRERLHQSRARLDQQPSGSWERIVAQAEVDVLQEQVQPGSVNRECLFTATYVVQRVNAMRETLDQIEDPEALRLRRAELLTGMKTGLQTYVQAVTKAMAEQARQTRQSMLDVAAAREPAPAAVAAQVESNLPSRSAFKRQQQAVLAKARQTLAEAPVTPSPARPRLH